MKDRATLRITCLLSSFLFALHWVDEIARGMTAGNLSGFGGVVILVVWVYGALVLGERRAGHVIMLLASVLGFGVLVLHMSGAGLTGGRIAHSEGVYFWVWTLIALGVTSAVSIVLSARGLWGLRRARSTIERESRS